jgi:DNA-binding HxlR family transcriptional regulator
VKKTVDPTCKAFQLAIEVLSRPSARLKDLETRRIVARHVDPGPPVRVQYTLTGKGRAFGEVAEAIERWGRELVVGEAPDAAPPARGTRRSQARRPR